jgi:hypothetical protein
LQAGLEHAMRDRVKNNQPTPGMEAALRRLILSLERGKPDYENASPLFRRDFAGGVAFHPIPNQELGRDEIHHLRKNRPEWLGCLPYALCQWQRRMERRPARSERHNKGLGSRGFHFDGGLF